MPDRLSDLVSRLRTFDTGLISDACERSGRHCQVVTGIAPLTAATAIAGAAITVRLGPAGEQPVQSTRHLGTTAVDSATDAHVIVIDHQGRDDCAGWGGNLSRGARQRGCAGTIVDGAVRDIDEATELGYPIYARSTTPRTARGRAVEVEGQVPIRLAGARVDPGDYVLADATGIVIIPQDSITDVLHAAATIATEVERIAGRIAKGTPITEAMGHDYERLLHGDCTDTLMPYTLDAS